MRGARQLKKPKGHIDIQSMEEDENSQESSRSDDESESICTRDEEEALIYLF